VVRRDDAAHHLLGGERVAGHAQAQLGAADVQLEVAAVVGELLRRAAGDTLAADDEAVLRLARGDDDRPGRAVGAGDDVDRRVVRGDVRIAQDDGVVERAADRDRPVVDPPRLTHQAVAVDHLQQCRRLA
jgi:hypothetical protein